MGLVLSGGQSSRMGKDKGLLTQENISWAAAAVEKLLAIGLPVSLSIRAEQFAAYSAVFSADMMIQDNAKLQYYGPLLGLMSAHTTFPHQDILVLACDMIDMNATILRLLINAQQTKPEYQAFCFINQGNMEPLAAIYSATGLAFIHEMYLSGKLPKHSMKYVLSILNTHCLLIEDDQLNSFKNFNTPTDLFGYQA